jgi:hypothetical protein
MMGFDLAGTTLANNAGLTATFSGSQVMKLGPTGSLQRYAGQPLFRASQSGSPVQTAMGAVGSFSTVILNKAAVNVAGCYNAGNGRFTAPVSGVYLVTAQTYCTGGAAGWYVHSMFFVNDSSSLRRPSGAMYRIRGHGHTAGYIDDTESFEIIPLLAGDYVTFVNNPGVANSTYVLQYSRFEGYLLN